MAGIPTDDLWNRFKFHPPRSREVADAHENIRGVCFEAAVKIVKLTDPCREQSLAITAMEEAMMWANAAIARHQLEEDDADAT